MGDYSSILCFVRYPSDYPISLTHDLGKPVAAVKIKHANHYTIDPRVGYPKLLLPDEGSQLVKGCKSMILSFVDLKQQLQWRRFETCPVGVHYMHGKIERKIQQVKKSISANMTSYRLSILQWESLVLEVTNGINNLPLDLGNKVECVENLVVLTPNRLLLGRNNDMSIWVFNRA